MWETKNIEAATLEDINKAVRTREYAEGNTRQRAQTVHDWNVIAATAQHSTLFSFVFT